MQVRKSSSRAAKGAQTGGPILLMCMRHAKCFTRLLYLGNPEVILCIFILALVLVWYLGPEVLGLLRLGKLPSFLEVPLKALILVSSICSQRKFSASAGPLLAKGQKLPKQCNRLCFLLRPSLELGTVPGCCSCLAAPQPGQTGLLGFRQLEAVPWHRAMHKATSIQTEDVLLLRERKVS